MEDRLTLLVSAAHLNVLFRVTPDQGMGEESLARLNIAICKALLKQDMGFVDYAQYRGQLGICFILTNSDLNEQHIDRFLDYCLSPGKTIKPDN